MSAPAENTEEIYLLNRRVRLLQGAGGFRPSLDTVLLAACCPALETAQGTVLDLGCGTGGAGFCLLRRAPALHLTGIDIQPANITLAAENAALNDAKDRAIFLCADVATYSGGPFDHVICNPPYLEAGAHTPSSDAARAMANGHIGENPGLGAWIDGAFRNLKTGGSLTIIHRADALDRIILALGRRFGASEIIPFWPHERKPAKRVAVRTFKNRKSPCTVHSGLVLHCENGDYTHETERILRNGEPLA
jgi:tRNA1(Val) A37 N6-methylase TrmN6